MKYLRINPVTGKERYYYINGIIYRFRGEQLQFTLEKNAEVVITQDGEVIKDRGTVDLNLLASAIYSINLREKTYGAKEKEPVFFGLTEIIFIELTSDNIDIYTDQMFAMQRNHLACVQAFKKR